MRDYKRLSVAGEGCVGGYVVARKTREPVVCPENMEYFQIDDELGGRGNVCAMPLQGRMCSVGNPILPFTGQKTQFETDHQSSGVTFGRYYNSVAWMAPFFIEKKPDQSSWDGNYFGTFGSHWRDSFDFRFLKISGDLAHYAISKPDGTVLYFDDQYKPLFRYEGTLLIDGDQQQYK